MRFTKSVVLAALATCTVVSARGVGDAATGPVVYTFSNPNQSVECLVLTEFGNQVRGYLEIDRRSEDSTTGETRERLVISQTLVGNGFTFDKYTAIRTADGFTLTSLSQDGQVSEQRLSRATADRVNASLHTLAINVRRSRALSELKEATAELRARGAAEQTPTAELARAQVRRDAAVMTARDLQMEADSLWKVANDLRAVADAQVESPGVSLLQNDLVKGAMENADQAERKARFAQRLATLAATDVTAYEGDVVATRNRIAILRERIEASAAILKSTGDVADR